VLLLPGLLFFEHQAVDQKVKRFTKAGKKYKGICCLVYTH